MTSRDDDPWTRFGARADAYARARPGYPRELVERLRAIGIGPGATVADLGAGTGPSTETLLATGAEVIAIEPSPEMRARLLERFGDDPRFFAVEGTAEATTLPPGSVDHAAAMQAAHWFDVAATRRELARVLRPGGRVALVWNTRTDESALMRDVEAIIRRFAPDYDALGHVGDRRQARVEALFFGTGRYEHTTLRHRHRLDRAGLHAYLASISYLPAPGSDAYAALVAATDRLVDDHGDDVELTLQTDLYVGS